MRLVRALSLVLVVAAAGCGSTARPVEYAPPQVIAIGTHELDGRNGVGFALDVRTLRLSRTGWEVEAGVVNATPVAWTIERPHVRGGTKFGLFVAQTPGTLRPAALEAAGLTTPTLLAAHFDPPIPQVLRPGDGWSGLFSGAGRIPSGSYVKVAFGRFVTLDRPPAGLPALLMALTAQPIRVG